MKRWIEINDRSAVAALRRLARRYATQIRLSDRRMEELAIAVTEAATNILRYAGQGRALIEVVRKPGVEKLVLLFTDRGPGIGDMDRMFQDGESSSDSAGLGLGAIQRLSDSFDVFSSSEDGTTIVFTFDASNAPPSTMIEVEGLRVCHPAEEVCGDDWMLRQTRRSTDILLCDGLGHGARAAEAAADVIGAAREVPADPGQTIDALTGSLVGTRGAVASMVRIEEPEMKLSYAGLGNISTICIGAHGTKRLAVRDGRIGGAQTRGFEEEMVLAPGDMIIMHSDGLKTLRDRDFRPGLLHRSPLLIAGFLLERSFRGRDDASIVVVRVKSERVT
ncbi:ATP-binding protein [Thioclava atlantica]|uniref:Serine/threonine-protein kinase RsbT-like protein n=1 Tax=Thioclava atlantica TaxID=1317124 RepID=A0A085TRQ6_9RHOB|nr:ATP-binding protein [Thioclava atlantica]KFE33403.1 serine/threonine-protein kinase RsbT-like protein [Thioclava atlantica]